MILDHVDLARQGAEKNVDLENNNFGWNRVCPNRTI